jgi:hypothetical protein
VLTNSNWCELKEIYKCTNKLVKVKNNNLKATIKVFSHMQGNYNKTISEIVSRIFAEQTE